MKIVWNGGFELDWKVLGAIVWTFWMTAAGWYKLEQIESRTLQIQEEMRVHSIWAASRSDDLTVIGARLNSLEERIDPCCPLFKGRAR